MRKKKYNKNNCVSKVRKTAKDKLGNDITLIGKHAFEWGIMKTTPTGITLLTFANRQLAEKEFNRLKE